MSDFLRKLFDSNERDIQKYRQTVDKINALEPTIQKLTNTQLRAKTGELQNTVQSAWQKSMDLLQKDSAWMETEQGGLSNSDKKDKTRKALDDVLDNVLPEAFAVVREAAKRTIGQRHYDVQLIGGMVTHDGRIGELRTGEGKTLMATLPLYLNALAGRGAHLVTANDYLSKVGAVWMGPIYHLLGMSVGIIQGQSPETGDIGGSYIYDPEYEDPDPRYTYCRTITRAEAYACDVTYGTNNEFGFDYLRDNMAFSADDLVMRDLHFAIVDEVDSILIDEARTPLIISGFVDQSTDMYYKVDRVIRGLRHGQDAKDQRDKDDPNHDRNNPNMDYLVDEKAKSVSPTDNGIAKIERALGIPDISENPEMMHHITAAMKAHATFKKDIDYVIKEGEIIIVDEFTGRLMFGRRYSDGLHQAIEAKEGVEIKHESQTLATITFQNLFRLYLKLAGMTGTAKTEEDEFRKIYGLDVVVVPTNKPMIRKDNPDVIYKLAEHKYRGVAAEILRLYARQQPVLVGTRSIEMSEKVSSRITGPSLQVLSMVSIIRAKLEASKSIDKQKKEQWNAALNADLDTLSLGKLSGMAKELGIAPDPLTPDNIREIAKMLELDLSSSSSSSNGGGSGSDTSGTPEHPNTRTPKHAGSQLSTLNSQLSTTDYLDEALRHGIPHNVLNAKFHEKEAIIIAEAGRKGAVTIATNMAGRGVDILLGGKPGDMELPPGQDDTLESSSSSPSSSNPGESAGTPSKTTDDREPAMVGGNGGAVSELPKDLTTEDEIEIEDEDEKAEPELSYRRGGKHSVLDSVTLLDPEAHKAAADEVRKLGGLYILGSERHESRRIDNQLRGRSGRQGDPGESRFYVSLEDELWRLFGDRANHPWLKTWPDDQSMDARILSKMIERAQKKVEQHHFESRKHVLQYDDVMNKQREVIYGERRRILEGANLRETILGFIRQTIVDAVAMFCPDNEPAANWEYDELYEGLDQYFPISVFAKVSDLKGKSKGDLEDYLIHMMEEAYAAKEQEITEASEGDPEAMRHLERWVALRAVNDKWMEHLAAMDYLREGIGLRGYAQQDPLVVYQKEAFEMFETMQHSIQDEVARFMFHVQLMRQEEERPRKEYQSWTNLDDGGSTTPQSAAAPSNGAGQPARNARKLGRNDPCWCGSGKKYKTCHYPN